MDTGFGDLHIQVVVPRENLVERKGSVSQRYAQMLQTIEMKDVSLACFFFC